MVRYYQTLR